MAADAGPSFLDGGDEIPRRERLRWEKELIGLYLSEHPLGDITEDLPDYVTAYTGDLAEETDQSKVTLGGIIISSRRIVTRAGSTMLVATLEDLQGSVEVVVFPKVFEQTANSWADDSVVLVTGRIDRRDDSPQILCEAVHQWDDAVRMGPVAFAAERDRLLAARGGGRRWEKQPERAQGVWGGGSESSRQAVAVAAPPPVAVAIEEPMRCSRTCRGATCPGRCRADPVLAGRFDGHRQRRDRRGRGYGSAARGHRVGQDRAGRASGAAPGRADHLRGRCDAPGAAPGPRGLGRATRATRCAARPTFRCPSSSARARRWNPASPERRRRADLSR